MSRSWLLYLDSLIASAEEIAAQEDNGSTKARELPMPPLLMPATANSFTLKR